MLDLSIQGEDIGDINVLCSVSKVILSLFVE